MKNVKKALASLVIAGMTLTLIPYNALAEGVSPTDTGASSITAAQIPGQTFRDDCNPQGGNSHATTLKKFLTYIMSYRGYLNPSEIDSINEARSSILTAAQDGSLSTVAQGLLTAQVLEKFQAEGLTATDAKVAITKALQDFQEVYFSSDKASMEKALLKFKNDNGGTFRILFGNDFRIELFYGYMMATQDEFQKAVKNEAKTDPFSLVELVSGSGNSTEIQNKVIEWLRTSLHEAADPTRSKYHVFDQKLADVGWNLDLLIKTQLQAGAVIDPSKAAQKAVDLSIIRSQIQCKVDGKIADPSTPIKLKKGNNPVKLVLSIKGINSGNFNMGSLLAWKTDNSAIATIAKDGSAIKAGTAKGTTVITAYRMNDPQIESNELIRIVVNNTGVRGNGNQNNGNNNNGNQDNGNQDD